MLFYTWYIVIEIPVKCCNVSIKSFHLFDNFSFQKVLRGSEGLAQHLQTGHGKALQDP